MTCVYCEPKSRMRIFECAGLASASAVMPGKGAVFSRFILYVRKVRGHCNVGAQAPERFMNAWSCRSQLLITPTSDAARTEHGYEHERQCAYPRGGRPSRGFT